MRNLVLILLARHGIGYLVEPRGRCSGPFWFAIGGHHLEELHGGSLNLNNVPSLQELALTIPSHYGRIWTNGRTVTVSQGSTAPAAQWPEWGQAVWKRREISVLVIPLWANLL